jgi:hypothetical protein
VIIAREVSVCFTLVYEAEFDYPKLWSLPQRFTMGSERFPRLNAGFDDWKPVIAAPTVYDGF